MWFLLASITQLLITQTKTNPEFPDGHLILRGGNNPCQGYVELYTQNTWGVVGDQFWNQSTEKVICSSTNCGLPVEGQNEDVLRPPDRKVWLNEVKCTGKERRLLDCNHPGEGVSFYRKDTVKKIKCSRQIKISLVQSKCEGIVQYSFKGESGHFCHDGFGKDEADDLCESLGCGKAKAFAVHQWLDWNLENTRKLMLNCTNIENPKHLWQCVIGKSTDCTYPASVTCQDHKRMRLRGRAENVCSGYLEIEEEDGVWIPFKSNQSSPDEWCRNTHCGYSVSYNQSDNGTLLTCKDKVKVLVSSEGGANRCYGAVYVEINNQKWPVCAEKWGRAESEVVCRELNCGRVISHEKMNLQEQTIMNQVTCLGNETSLWHCRAMRARRLPCPHKAFVVCSDSVDVSLKDGQGKCAGRLEILHGNMWKQVPDEQWKDNNSDVVCNQLGCGKSRQTSTPENYSRDLKDFLTYRLQCNKNSKHISECFAENATRPRNNAVAVGITCEDHKILILKGDDPCSGLVGIVKGDEMYWLSGSKATWNQESANAVCQQKHCGKASSFNSSFLKNINETSVWTQSYNCSPGAKSLFDCAIQIQKQPFDPNTSIAEVKCSGKITITLANQCWGQITTCLDGQCGSVCKESMSPMYLELCKSLQCGDKVVKSYSQSSRTPAKIKSLHRTKYTTNLTQSHFVMNEEQGMCSPATVVCSGSLKPRFSNSGDKCSGNVEVFHEGRWLPVCKQGLHKEAQDIICEELRCGEAAEIIKHFGPTPITNLVINNLQCEANSTSLSVCDISFDTKPCETAGLKCTDWRTMRTLEPCKGPVLVYSDGQRSAVAVDGWTTKEGEKLCQDLQCGRFESLDNHSTLEQFSFWNRSFSCEDNAENIWDCEKPVPPSKRQQLFIRCKDVPKINLSDNCQGVVKIDGTEVCDSFWNLNNSHMVCQQQQCSNAILTVERSVSNPNADYYHVNCDDFHHELSQCRRVLGKCSGKLVSVNCVGSVKFETSQKGGGQLWVNYREKWERVCPVTLSPRMSDNLCHQLTHKVSSEINESADEVDLETALQCNENHRDIRHCVTLDTCKNVRPAEIFCKGYKPSQPQNTVPEKDNRALAITVGLVLLIVIIVLPIISIHLIKKYKKTSFFTEKELSRKAAEIESGEYEEVHSNADEMEELSKRPPRSPTETFTAEQACSADSLTNYEEADAQPLNSEQSDGESYDDIDLQPEVNRTRAEIHQSPQSIADGGKVEVASAQDGAHQVPEEHA